MSHKYSFNCIWSKDDKAFIVTVPELPGCAADGATVEEALKELEIVVAEWIQTAKEDGRTVPKPFTTEDNAAWAKKFREELSKHIKREVESAVQKVIQEISAFNPALTGGRDPADYWKNS